MLAQVFLVACLVAACSAITQFGLPNLGGLLGGGGGLGGGKGGGANLGGLGHLGALTGGLGKHHHHVPQPYAFGYQVKDKKSNHHREEKGDGKGGVKGSYGYKNAKGLYRQVDYVADKFGFRASVKTNEPGTSNQNPAHVDYHHQQPPHHAYHDKGILKGLGHLGLGGLAQHGLGGLAQHGLGGQKGGGHQGGGLGISSILQQITKLG